MSDSTRLKYLRIALVLVGIIFIFGIYSLMIAWPSGWTWHTGHSDYPLMIVGIYATLGVFLILAARDPLAHLSLIWFYCVGERGAQRHHGGAIERRTAVCHQCVCRRTLLCRSTIRVLDIRDPAVLLNPIFVSWLISANSGRWPI